MEKINVKKSWKSKKKNILIYYKCDHQFLASFVLHCFDLQLHGSTRIQMTHCFFLYYLFILIEKSNEQKLLYNHVEHLFHSNSFRCSSSIVFQQNRIFCCRLLRIRSSSRSVFYSRRSGFHLIIMIFQSFQFFFIVFFTHLFFTTLSPTHLAHHWLNIFFLFALCMSAIHSKCTRFIIYHYYGHQCDFFAL